MTTAKLSQQTIHGRHRAVSTRSARTYSAHVGRVGALAVALGIGAAVASAPGVAWAEGPEDTKPPTQEADTAPPADPNTPTATPDAAKPDFGEAIRRNLDRAAKDVRKALTGIVRNSGGAHTSTHGTGSANGNVPEIIEDDEGLPTTPPPTGVDSTQTLRNNQNRQQASVTTTPTAVGPQFHQTTTAVVTRIHQAFDANEALRTTTHQVTTALSPTAANGAGPGAAAARFSLNTDDTQDTAQITAVPEPGPVTRIVTGLLAAIGFGPAATNGNPIAPASGPTLLGALGLIRRELEHLFVNKTPDITGPATPLIVDQGDDQTFTLPAYDADGDRLTYTVTDGPDEGDLSPTPVYDATTRTYTYTYTAHDDADTDAAIDDTITLTASDANAGFHIHGLASLFNPQGAHTDTVTVGVNIEDSNDAPTAVGGDGPFTTVEDTPRVFTASQLVSNDTDPDANDTLSVASVDGATNGTVMLNGDGTVTFTPTANHNGPASFTYKVKDAAGAISANAVTVNLTVTAANDAPTAVGGDGPFTTVEDTPRVFTASQLVGNDTDPDANDTLSVASVDGATNGTVMLNGDGTVTFTPTANHNGPASFTYKVKDAAGAISANAVTVILTVTAANDAPTAVGGDGPFTTVEDTPRVFTASQLVGNDTDPDANDTLSVASVDGATNGTVMLNGDGTVTFTPTANHNGPASFTYKVKDAAGAISANAVTVNLTVTAANDAPTAVGGDGPFTTVEDTPRVFTASQLVGNDTDPDANDTLSVASVDGATNGTVMLNGDGTVTFTPTANHNGPASFTYKVKDAAGAISANAVTVNLTVTAANDAPTAVGGDGPFTTVEDTPRVFTASQLVGNDTDPDANDTLSVASVDGATNGTVMLNGNGTVTFTPTANHNGPASFTYKVKDAAGAISANSVTVNLTVTSVNDLPTAVNDGPFTGSEDAPLTLTAAQLVGNDQDVESTSAGLRVASVSGGTNGTAVLNSDGSVTFTPHSRYSGPASFTYRTADAANGVSANSATVTMNFAAVNDDDLEFAAVVDVDGTPTNVAISPDGSKAFVANANGTVSVINTSTNTLIDTNGGLGGVNPITLPANQAPQALAVSSDGTRLYVATRDATTGAGQLRVYRTDNYAPVSTITVGNNPVDIAVAGSRIYVANNAATGNGSITVINANSADSYSTVGQITQNIDKPIALAIGDNDGDVYMSSTLTPMVGRR